MKAKVIQFTLIIGQRRTVESKSDPTYNCQSRTCESEAPPQGFQGPRAQKLLGPHHKAS